MDALAKATPMDRLEAVFWLLLQSGPDDLEARKEAARRIAGLDDEEEAPPGAETPSAPRAMARAGSVLRYLAAGPVRPRRKAGALLARLYAVVYAACEAAGASLPEGELEEANEELAPHGWSVEEADGSFRAVPLPRHYRKGGPLLYGRFRAPKGGITIGGVFYPGGKFVPAAALAAAGMATLPSGEEEEPAKVQERQQQALASYSSSAPPLASVRRLAASFPVRGSASRPAALSALRVLRASHGPAWQQRLARLSALLARAKAALDARSAPAADYRTLADSAAVLSLAARLGGASPGEADSMRVLVPEGGRLWLLPGIPADAEREFMQAGFARAAPGRWAAPDTPEARSLAQEHGFRLVLPARGGNEA